MSCPFLLGQFKDALEAFLASYFVPCLPGEAPKLSMRSMFNHLEDFQYLIVSSCKQLSEQNDLYETLAEFDLPVEDESFTRRFSLLYNKLCDETPVWELRGHTPPQLSALTDYRM